jgi:hypothetical protein
MIPAAIITNRGAASVTLWPIQAGTEVSAPADLTLHLLHTVMSITDAHHMTITRCSKVLAMVIEDPGNT